MKGIEITFKLPQSSIEEIADKVFKKAKKEGYFTKTEPKKDENEPIVIDGENYISLKNASKKLDGLGDRTIIRHIKNEIFIGKKVGNQWRVLEKSINEYINNKNK